MNYPKAIRIWLWVGLIMVAVQVIIGGITRLTDSGLSITDWEVVKGVWLPDSDLEWQEAFEEYKAHAKAQYERLHKDMSISEFKWIYFWEWFHRLWARLMGMIFIIPFLFFWWKGWIDKRLMKHLLWIIGFGALAGIMGWLMVKSGLNNDQRTWVSAYRLILHLFIALLTFASIYWTILYLKIDKIQIKNNINIKKIINITLFVFVLQVLFGGLMAGMRAGLIHPHWPFFIDSDPFYSMLSDSGVWFIQNWIDYEPNPAIKAWIQIIHRILAYVLFLLSVFLSFRILKKYRDPLVRSLAISLLILMLIQITLGIWTVINAIGNIPVVYGVIHQIFAFIVLACLLKLRYVYRGTKA